VSWPQTEGIWPHPIYSDTVDAIEELLYELHIVVPFEWMAWDGVRRYTGGRGLAEEPVADAVRLATAIIRGERFFDGTIKAAIADGALSAVLARLHRWYEEERAT
jgi:hypothetical protein